MIYTLTLNPAIDYRMNISGIEYGATNRSSGEEISFGGKGINVSKVLKNLGVETVAFGFCAGFTGKALREHLDECGIKHEFVELSLGQTRINIKLCDKDNRETEINACGPEVSQAEKNMLFEKLGKSVSDGDTVILSGSVPSGMGSDTYACIMNMLSNKRIRFVVDAAGELLKNTLKHKPFLIKPNISELSGFFCRELSSEQEIARAAEELVDMGAQNVLVSMGGDGALLAGTDGKVQKISSHKGVPVNTVGSGDSMVAGFVAGYEVSREYALALGNACGGATAFSQGLATAQEVEKLLEKMN